MPSPCLVPCLLCLVQTHSARDYGSAHRARAPRVRQQHLSAGSAGHRVAALQKHSINLALQAHSALCAPPHRRWRAVLHHLRGPCRHPLAHERGCRRRRGGWRRGEDDHIERVRAPRRRLPRTFICFARDTILAPPKTAAQKLAAKLNAPPSRTLVWSKHGLDRAPAVVAAYLIRRYY